MVRVPGRLPAVHRVEALSDAVSRTRPDTRARTREAHGKGIVDDACAKKAVAELTRE